MEIHLVEVVVGGAREFGFPVGTGGVGGDCCRHANQNDNKVNQSFHRCLLESSQSILSPLRALSFYAFFPGFRCAPPWAIFLRSLRELGVLPIRLIVLLTKNLRG